MRATRLEGLVKERFGNEVMGEEDVVRNITRALTQNIPRLLPESRQNTTREQQFL
jgi:hypothetical protein